MKHVKTVSVAKAQNVISDIIAIIEGAVQDIADVVLGDKNKGGES